MEAGECQKTMLDSQKNPIEATTIKISAPGKVILHGEHSVVFNRLAVSASLGLRTVLTLDEVVACPARLNLNFTDINIAVTYEIKDITKHILSGGIPLRGDQFDFERPESIDQKVLLERIEAFLETQDAPKDSIKRLAILTFLYLYCAILPSSGLPLKSLDACVQSEIQVSAGMGSSAAFAVSIAGSLIEYVKTKFIKTACTVPNGYKVLADGTSGSFSERELQLVSLWAFHAEKITHGNPSGIDNSICTYGSVVEFRKGSDPKPLRLHHKLRALLIDTTVPKSTRALVQRVVNFRERFPHILEHTLDSMEIVARSAIDCLTALSEISKAGTESRADFTKQYLHLGELVDMNQNMLRVLGVSHPAIDKICAILTEHGLHGKLTGAGGGGFVVSVVPLYTKESVLDEAKSVLEGEGFIVRILELGGQGVMVH